MDFGRFSLRVIPSLHSQLFAKHYNNSEFSGPVVSGLKAPLRESAMKALDNPPIVLPTRWDSYANATIEKSRSEVQAFSAEIKAACPHTRVIVPEYFKPMTFN